MKTDKKITIAFFLNFFFSVFEFVGGALTGSVAIVSDAIHDIGDALSIGMSLVFEKISHKKPNNKYTYGYYRFSVLGSVIQSVVLLSGSVIVVYNAITRLINPIPINYSGMIVIAIIGFGVYSLVVIVPAFAVIMVMSEIVVFFGNHGMKYYIDQDTIISPKKHEELDKINQIKFLL